MRAEAAAAVDLDVDVDIDAMVAVGNVIVVAGVIIGGAAVVNVDVAMDGGKTDNIPGASVIS